MRRARSATGSRAGRWSRRPAPRDFDNPVARVRCTPTTRRFERVGDGPWQTEAGQTVDFARFPGTAEAATEAFARLAASRR
jgi:hypothetical protein